MSTIGSGRFHGIIENSAKYLVVASLGVASFAVFALNGAPASASTGVAGPTALANASLAAHLKAKVASGTWNTAIEVPGSATLNSGDNAGVVAISCTSSGNCSAGGNYLDGSGHLQAFVVNETGGTWGSTIEVPGTAALNAGGSAIVNSISCTSDGNCGAAGAYTDATGNVWGFVVTESGGTWGVASEVMDPLAIGSANASGAASISCTANGSCSAVGFDVVTGGVPVGFVTSETGGTWSAATDITITSSLGAGGDGMVAVSCSSPGNCSAEGTAVYNDAAVHGGLAYIPFEVNQTGGTWGSASTFPGLSTLNVGLVATAVTISCTRPGDCGAGGQYTDGLGNSQAFVADETNGRWGNAVEVPGTSSLNVGAAVTNSISCTSPGNCGASGLYTTATLSEAFVVTETNGSWGTAEEVPGSSTLFFGGAAVENNPISCSSAGNCSSGGAYIDVLGNYEAFVVTEKSGLWGNVIEVPGSAALNTAGGAQVTAISCPVDSSCGAGGYYSPGSSNFQAFVTDMSALFAPQAALKLTSSHGKVGTALKLTTSGGTGTGAVTFTVTNGTAKGCKVATNVLTATRAGTCVVTATKVNDGTYNATSSPATPVAMALPPRPGLVTVTFAANSSALRGTARNSLTALARKLVSGASTTVTGYAAGNAKLAKSRATAVAKFLSGKVHEHATIKTVTTSASNKATVATTKQ